MSAGGDEGEAGDLLDGRPHAPGAAAGGAPDDVLAAVTALRRRDAALAASAARSSADPGLTRRPHPGRAPAAGGLALAFEDHAVSAAAGNPGDVGDSDGAEGGSGAREGAGGAAPGVVSFVGARELTTQRKRRRREPPLPEQPPAKRKAGSKAQGASSLCWGFL